MQTGRKSRPKSRKCDCSQHRTRRSHA